MSVALVLASCADQPGTCTADSTAGPSDTAGQVDSDGGTADTSDGGHDTADTDTGDTDTGDTDTGAVETCGPMAADVTEVGVRSECRADVAAAESPWDVEIIYDLVDQWDEDAGCRPMAIVDLDGDGLAELLCATNEGNYIHSPLDEGSPSTLLPLGVHAPMSVADTDEDGDLEIYGTSEDGEAVRLSSSGETSWTGDVGFVTSRGTEWARTTVPLARSDASAEPTLFSHAGAVDAATGEVVGTYVEAADLEALSLLEQEVVALDLDQDGDVEVAALWTTWTADGAVVTEAEQPGYYTSRLFVMVVQADDDPTGEILWADEDGMTLSDGAETLWRIDAGAANPFGMPCVGDIDGDGTWNLIVPTYYDGVWAFDEDGVRMWSYPTSDSTTGAVGCTVFDFELDGAGEVMAADEDGFFILDGTTGAALYVDETYASPTALETPQPVDLDGDGSVEIVLGHRAGWEAAKPGLRIYAHADAAWPPGRDVWGWANWTGTGLDSKHRVPRTQDAPWLTHGLWRGQPANPGVGVDLRPEVVDACTDDCDAGPVWLSLRVANGGPEEAWHDIEVEVYALPEGTDLDLASPGDGTLVDTVTVSDWVDNGWTTPTVEVSVSVETAMNGVLFSMAHDDECSDDDDVLAWRFEGCDQR